MTEPLSESERNELIEDFEQTGFATFRLGEEQAQFKALMDYVRECKVPIFTDIDREAETVTITKRPMGSLEMG